MKWITVESEADFPKRQGEYICEYTTGFVIRNKFFITTMGKGMFISEANYRREILPTSFIKKWLDESTPTLPQSIEEAAAQFVNEIFANLTDKVFERLVIVTPAQFNKLKDSIIKDALTIYKAGALSPAAQAHWQGREFSEDAIKLIESVLFKGLSLADGYTSKPFIDRFEEAANNLKQWLTTYKQKQ